MNDTSRKRRGPASLTALLVAGLAAATFLPAHPAASEGLPDQPARPTLPAYTDPELTLQEFQRSIWNAKGTLRANLGGLETLDVRAEDEPGIYIAFDRRGRAIEVKTGVHIETEGETSIKLVLERKEHGWELSGGEVFLEGRHFIIQQGEVNVLHVDEQRGELRATFSFRARAPERRPSFLRVRNGSLDVRSEKPEPESIPRLGPLR